MNPRLTELIFTLLGLVLSVSITIFAFSERIILLQVLGIIISAILALAIIIEFTSLIEYGHQTIYRLARPIMHGAFLLLSPMGFVE